VNPERWMDRLEDLVVLRDRLRLRTLRETAPLQLKDLYSRFKEYIDIEHIHTHVRALRERYAVIPIDGIAAYRVAFWLGLEAATIATLQPVREGWTAETLPGSGHTLAEAWWQVRCTGDRDRVVEFIQGIDRLNPLRLQWWTHWQVTLKSWRIPNGYTLLERWQGWDLDLWDRIARDYLDAREDAYSEGYHAVLQPESSERLPHWSLWWQRMADFGTDWTILHALDTHGPMRLWQDRLDVQDTGTVDIAWYAMEPARAPAVPVTLFDGDRLWLVRGPAMGNWLDVWERLYLWGLAQVAMWTPLNYRWTRLAGGDPAIRIGWGFWVARWMCRPGFWRAVDLEDVWDTQRIVLQAWDHLYGRWLAAITVHTLEAQRWNTRSLDRFLHDVRVDLQRRLGLAVEPECVVPWVIHRGWPIRDFRAWIFAEGVHRYLEDRFGTDWWRERMVRHLLMDLWHAGTDPTVEDLLKDLGLPVDQLAEGSAGR